MKVWHLNSNPWNSAISEYALSSILALEKRGIESIYSPLSDSKPANRATQLGIPTQTVKSFNPINIFELLKSKNKISPEVIISYGGPETFMTKFLSLPACRFYGAWRNTLPTNYRHIKTIICPNKKLAERIQKANPKIHTPTITLGRNREVYRFQKHRKKNPQPTILIFGRFDPIKGHHPSLKLFKKLLDQWPETMPKPVLKIIGEEANISANEIANWTQELGVSQNVIIRTERVQDVPTLLSEADLGLIPSTDSEEIGRIAEEFLMCGTRIFTSGVGGLEEILFPEAGYSYREQDEKTVLKNLEKWLIQGFQEEDRAKKARSLQSQAMFGLEPMGIALEQVLDQTTFM